MWNKIHRYVTIDFEIIYLIKEKKIEESRKKDFIAEIRRHATIRKRLEKMEAKLL